MAGTHAKSTLVDLRERFLGTFVPTQKDKPLQIVLKLLSLVSVVALITSTCYLSGYFISGARQRSIIAKTRAIWHNEGASKKARFNTLLSKNSDFKCWLSVDGTEIDNPVYQAKNNKYYLKHNQNKQPSRYGALFLDCDSKSPIIYGNTMNDGTMLTGLKGYRNLGFYKSHPTVTLSTANTDSQYVVFAVLLHSDNPADDGGHTFSLKNSFSESKEFYLWYDEALERSIINTGIEVNYGDSILTLVTRAPDFDGAQLVVMARRLNKNEDITEITDRARVNPSPRHPKRWYEH